MTPSGVVSRSYSVCLTGKSIAYEATKVKPRAISLLDRQLADYYLQWLKAEMTAGDWEPAKLASKARLNPASLWKILQRRVIPELKTWERLAKAMGVEVPQPHLDALKRLPKKHDVPPGAPLTDDQADVAGPPLAGEGTLDLDANVANVITRSGARLAPQIAASVKTVATMQAATVARLVKDVLVDSEIGHTEASRKAIIEFLERTATEFRKFGADVSDLLFYANQLKGEQ